MPPQPRTFANLPRSGPQPAYGWLLGLALLAVSCSDDQTRTHNADLQTAPAASRQATPETPATTSTTEAPDSPAQSGKRYRVTAETAYFFDAPQQTRPSGQYLLRGDVVYGEEERGGFVKTRFVNPRGATVVGWLRAQELSRLAAKAAPATVRRTAPTAPDEAYSYEIAESPVAVDATAAGATAVVQVPRSYFYNSPDLLQPRKAHCVQGDKVRLGETRGDAVFVTFTNWEKVTTTGWMRKDALRFSR